MARKTGKLYTTLCETRRGGLKETIQIFTLDGDQFVATLDGVLIHLGFLYCLIEHGLNGEDDDKS